MNAMEPEMEPIAPTGDIVLVVGDTTKLKLRVSSTVLTKASQVFAALLGLHFLEGQQPASAAQPKEISLPDDDKNAMTDLCKLLHNEQVPDLLQPTSDQILSFAIVVDKYDCADRLQLQIQGILLGYLLQTGTQEPECLAKQMLAAYLLRHAQAFGLATACLINRTTYPCCALLGFDWAQRIPLSWIYALAEQRNRAINEIIFTLPSFGERECDYGCKDFDTHYMETLCKAVDIEHWPPDLQPSGTCTILTAAEMISNLGTVDLRQFCAHVERDEIPAQELKDFAEQLGLLCRVLCLRCAMENEVVPRRICEDPSHR